MAVGRLVTHTGHVVDDGGVGPEIGPIRMRCATTAFPSLLALDNLVTVDSESFCFEAWRSCIYCQCTAEQMQAKPSTMGAFHI